MLRNFAALAATGAAAVVLAVAGVALLQFVPGQVGGVPSPSTAPGAERFTSRIHGISIDLPAGWQARPATQPWTGGPLAFDSQAADIIDDPALGDRVYLSLASQPYGTQSQDEWQDAIWFGWLCADSGFGGGGGRVDGTRAWFLSCGDGHGVFVFGQTRGYFIRLVVPGDDPQLVETYDSAWLDGIVETIDLRPEEAIDVPGSTPSPSPSPSASPLRSASASPTTAPSLDPSAHLLNSFLEARVAGAGAEEYLEIADDVIFGDIPLLYTTTSGAPYERAEFEPVTGIEWPYGWIAFKVRLFAGDTVVEQLFFTPADLTLNPDPAARGKLIYVPDGFGTDIAPTTENGQPVSRPYVAFDGEATLHVAHPWVFHYDGGPIRLIPADAPPTTDGGERNSWVALKLVADPTRVGSDCQAVPGPADADAVAESIRSVDFLETTAPMAVTGGLMMEVAIAADSTRATCTAMLNGLGRSNRMRIYLFDAPEGASMQTVAIVMVVPEGDFERAVAGRVIDSIEFHAP